MTEYSSKGQGKLKVNAFSFHFLVVRVRVLAHLTDSPAQTEK